MPTLCLLLAYPINIVTIMEISFNEIRASGPSGLELNKTDLHRLTALLGCAVKESSNGYCMVINGLALKRTIRRILHKFHRYNNEYIGGSC